jgi:hypothetical protein
MQGGAEPNLDLSSMNLGSADLQLLSTLFTAFNLSAPDDVKHTGRNLPKWICFDLAGARHKRTIFA